MKVHGVELGLRLRGLLDQIEGEMIRLVDLDLGIRGVRVERREGERLNSRRFDWDGRRNRRFQRPSMTRTTLMNFLDGQCNTNLMIFGA